MHDAKEVHETDDVLSHTTPNDDVFTDEISLKATNDHETNADVIQQTNGDNDKSSTTPNDMFNDDNVVQENHSD